MKNKVWKRIVTAGLAATMVFSLTACGGAKVELNDGTFKPMDASELAFPQAEKVTLTGLINYPANTTEPKDRTSCTQDICRTRSSGSAYSCQCTPPGR